MKARFIPLSTGWTKAGGSPLARGDFRVESRFEDGLTMSLWSRIANVFRPDRLNRDIEEELQSHLAEAIGEGRDPAEVRRALGPVLAHREKSRDIRLVPWLDSLHADAVFGWRQLRKRKGTSAAAILSLALAIGSCVAAFRIIDAVLWRPLPIDAPGRLYVLGRQSTGPDGKLTTSDNCAYPMFRQMRALVKDQAELIAISSAGRIDLTFGSEEETEKAYQQYVSGWMFGSFGVRPAMGRVFTEADDLTPGAHPYAVISNEYWQRRFGADPKVIGRTFRTGRESYQIVGVAEGPFTGTEPGTVTDIFVPTMMMKNNAIVRSDYRWFRTFLKLKPGFPVASVREKLSVSFRNFLAESVKQFAGIPKQEREGYLSQQLLVSPAPSGVSRMQGEYRTALSVLGVLVFLVLLISCVNVANLMTAQAAARQREMALRVSIGAGRWRLIQLVIVECAWLAILAVCAGGGFAWWVAPWIVGMIGTPDNPTQLILPADWRVLAFGLSMALGVTILFGLTPALRASGVKPANASKGGDPHSRSRLMHVLIAAQVAFCVLVLFVAGLFLATSIRLSQQRTGFSTERLLTLETVTPAPQPAALWEQVADHLRTKEGVEAVALSEWPLMTGSSWNGFIAADGAAPSQVASYFLAVSPKWREVMKIPLLQGRDFLASDPPKGSALVNEAFARQYFGGESPVGRSFEVVANEGHRRRYQVVGLVADARYRDMREPMQPTAYFPFKANYGRATFIVRTANGNPLALRQEVSRARPGFRVSNVLTQSALVEQHLVRERLLAMLALFFGAVALSLAGVGLYGVLDYSVLQRRREIGIRIAIGARAGGIARLVTVELLAAVITGLVFGITLGMASARFIETLLYEVKSNDWAVLALPTVTIFAAALLAALPAVVRAVRIDPATILRSE
jgi:putative ABC transport system permease protein